MSFLENLFHGKLSIHQELINKLIREAIEENEIIKDIRVSITGGFIYLTAGIRAAENLTIGVKLVLILGDFEFNKTNRFVELLLHDPVLISIQGIDIKARLEAELDPDPAKRAGVPEVLVNLLQFLTIKEDKIILDFNKMPVLNQSMQNKLGIFLKYLEITKLELAEEMIIIHPTVKLY